MSNLIPVEPVRNTNNTLFTGIKYAFKGRASQKHLDGRDKDGMNVLVTDRNPVGDGHLNWYIHPSDESFYALRNERSRCYLDGRNKTSSSEVFVTNRNHSGDRVLQWSFEQVQGFYGIKGRESEKYLDGRNATSDTKVFVTNRPLLNDYVLQWQYIPTAYKLTAQIVNFKYDAKYDDLSKFAKQSPSFVAWTMRNESPDVPLTANPNIRQTRENYNSWSFTQSKERSFVGSIEASVSAEFMGIGSSVTSKAEWSTKDTTIEGTERRLVDTTEISMLSSINIPPKKEVSYAITWSDVQVFIDYTATVRISGFADRTTRDGSTVTLQKIPADATLSLIRHAGYDGNVIGIDGDVVTIGIKGVMEAKGAINGNLVMNSVDI